MPKDLKLDNSVVRSYQITTDYVDYDLKANFLRGKRITGRYTCGLSGDSVRWNDFFLKQLNPIVSEALKNAIEKFKVIHSSKVDFTQIESFINQLQPKTIERFLIEIGEHCRSVQFLSVNCFYIKEHCNFINVTDGKNYAIDYSLDKVEQMIDSRMFFRVSRNWMDR